MKIFDLDVDFDFTSPKDVLRYKQASEKKSARAAEVPNPTVPITDPKYIDEYLEMINQTLRIYGDFLNEAFGEGTAEELLGDNPSITKSLEVQEAIEKAFEKQGKELGLAMAKYMPNQATADE